MSNITYNEMIRNKDLISFTDTAMFLCRCPDCNTKITKDHLVEEYDTIAKCPSCALRIYIG